MSIFMCTECECIENTSNSRYWNTGNLICSECDPDIGKWHNRFLKRKIKVGMLLDAEGFVYSSKDTVPECKQVTHVYTENGVSPL